MTRGGLVLLALAVALGAAQPAVAGESDLTSAELRELAQEAATDEEALEELARVEEVDGRPVALDTALADAEGDTLRRRLETLADRAETAPPPPDARREAQAILDDRRYEGTELPKPLEGVIDWLAERLRPVKDAFDAVAARLPGGRSTLWTIIAALVVGLAALVAWRVSRRGLPGGVEGGRVRIGDATVDPGELERAADEAEREGDLELALRLRFRAGLLRLHRAKAIAVPESVTTREVRRRLRSSEFDRVAATFDRVVYGGKEPEPADAEEARSLWPAVIRGAKAA